MNCEAEIAMLQISPGNLINLALKWYKWYVEKTVGDGEKRCCLENSQIKKPIAHSWVLDRARRSKETLPNFSGNLFFQIARRLYCSFRIKYEYHFLTYIADLPGKTDRLEHHLQIKFNS